MSVDDVRWAWFHVRPKDQTLKLREGEKLDVGSIHATVARIGHDDVEIQETDGHRRVLTKGDQLNGDRSAERGQPPFGMDPGLFPPMADGRGTPRDAGPPSEGIARGSRDRRRDRRGRRARDEEQTADTAK